LVTRDCGSGTVVVAQENLENIIPAEKNIRIEFGGMQDKTAHLDELILGTRNPGGTLSVDLAPATVLQSYPGLSGTLNTAHLIFNYAAPQQMATAVRQVIEYAIEQWRIQHNAPSVLYALQVSVNAPTPGSGKISIVLGVYHQPTQAYVCLQPTVSTLSGYQDQGVYTTTAASVDGQGSVQLLAEAAYVVQACNATIRRDYQVTIGYGSNQVTPEGWYTIESGVLSAVPLGGQTSSVQCQETPALIDCEEIGEICADATCVPCLPAEPVAPLCSGAELAALPQELADLDQLMTHTGVTDLLFPIVLYRLRFCDGSRRYVFDRELGGIDADYVMEQRLIVRSAADLYRLTYNNGASGQIGAVDVILSQRPGNNGLLITPLPPLQQSSAPGDPLSGDNPGNEGDGRPQVSYYNYDHLGNTRVVYHSVINCAADSIHYMLEYAADYYPFGSILREWSNCEKSRFLFTHKERDAETGWDNLGARLYDSDVCRFLGVDPLGEERSWVNPYNYVQNNPILRIDPLGALDNPIYDTDGNFLGTDDKGLQGSAIIMDKTNFSQGMSHSEAKSHHLGAGKLKGASAVKKQWEHYSGLSKRPDWDGFVTIEEGIAWAKNRPNSLNNNDPNDALYLDASKLNFGDLSVNNIGMEEGQTRNVNLFDYVNWSSSSSRSTTYALGNTRIQLVNSQDGTIRLFQDIYDWDYHNYSLSRQREGKLPESRRDKLIYYERKRAGVNDSHGFSVFIYGTGKIKTD
jgi:RHS repeat-associated protein